MSSQRKVSAGDFVRAMVLCGPAGTAGFDGTGHALSPVPVKVPACLAAWVAMSSLGGSDHRARARAHRRRRISWMFVVRRDAGGVARKDPLETAAIKVSLPSRRHPQTSPEALAHSRWTTPHSHWPEVGNAWIVRRSRAFIVAECWFCGPIGSESATHTGRSTRSLSETRNFRPVSSVATSRTAEPAQSHRVAGRHQEKSRWLRAGRARQDRPASRP